MAVIGAIVGGFVGWVIAAATSSGPKTPLEAFSGDYERSGVGCFGFVLLVGGGALVGGVIGALLSGS